MYIWQYDKLEKVLKHKCYFSGNFVRINSNDIEKDDIFIAFNNGVGHNGHKYVKHALIKGAACCIVNQDEVLENNIFDKKKLIKVKDTKVALDNLAIYKRLENNGIFISITGSNGKTTTKNFLHQVLKYKAFNDEEIFCSYKNFNNLLGVKINLASLNTKNKYIILEVGMSHKGEIEKISHLVQPNQISIITNIGKSHLQNFINQKAIAEAKSEIFSHMRKGSIVILPQDSEYFSYLKDKALFSGLNIFTFGVDNNSDAQLISIENHKFYSIMKFKVFDKVMSFQVPFFSVNYALNLLCVLLCTNVLGFGLNGFSSCIRNIKLVNSRGNIINGKENISILDFSYNANPDSVRTNLQEFKCIAKCNKVLILGDMLELGKDEVLYHNDLLDSIIDSGIYKLILVGKLTKKMFNLIPKSLELYHFSTYLDVITNASKIIKNNDFVMVQGSNSLKLKNIVDYLS